MLIIIYDATQDGRSFRVFTWNRDLQTVEVHKKVLRLPVSSLHEIYVFPFTIACDEFEWRHKNNDDKNSSNISDMGFWGTNILLFQD